MAGFYASDFEGEVNRWLHYDLVAHAVEGDEASQSNLWPYVIGGALLGAGVVDYVVNDDDSSNDNDDSAETTPPGGDQGND